MNTLVDRGVASTEEGERVAGTSRPDPVRFGLVVLVAAWMTSYVRNDRYWSLLDGVDLAIHEAGHVVFAPLGEFAAVAGGSVFQVLVPALFVVHFAWRREWFGAFVVLFWVSQSLFNVAVYIADARAQVLPLVGGEYVIHDWSWMLSRLRLLTRDEAIAGGVRVAASLMWITATGGGLLFARQRIDGERVEAG